ncbi:MAG TPA: family 43 glycosylhydrolase, partial [Phycisphaerae bacterium]|nr:family 43 glycosylhydrolase [Phycisphaerae bacterium]
MLKFALIFAGLAAAASVVQAADAPDTASWARFSAFSYSGSSPIAPKAGEYLNPIIAGFHPDPSICRAGDDYYLVNSAFNYFPSIPIWHSRDLVNWTQIGNVLDRPSQFPMRGGAMDRGTYAPTIRYHDGTFYVVCTLVGSGLGNFYVTARDARGPWSEPIKLQGIGGIDPDLFFDDDGKCYVTSCDDPPQPQYNGHRAMKLQALDLEQKKPVGEKTIIIDGGTDLAQHPIWCEGPHLYKINGKYFAMCAQGGTGPAHSEVMFKSDNVRGPYLPWDKNPILSQMGLPANRPDPVTCTGHADLVQTQNGEWYAVFLGCRPYQAGFYNTGREAFMLPVTWTPDGWPVILPPHTPVPLTVKKPNLPEDKPVPIVTTGNISYTENFDSESLAARWTGVRVPTSKWYEISPAAKALFLQPRADLLSGQGNSSFLAVRQQNNDFTCTVTLAAQPATTRCVAGLAAFQNETHYFAINVTIDSGRLAEIAIERPAGTPGRGGNAGRGRGGGSKQPAAQPGQKLPADLASIQLKIEGAGPVTRCFYKPANGEF